MKLIPTCKQCGSKNVIYTGRVEWNFDRQQWMNAERGDEFFGCCECLDPEVELDWVVPMTEGVYIVRPTKHVKGDPEECDPTEAQFWSVCGPDHVRPELTASLFDVATENEARYCADYMNKGAGRQQHIKFETGRHYGATPHVLYCTILRTDWFGPMFEGDAPSLLHHVLMKDPLRGINYVLKVTSLTPAKVLEQYDTNHDCQQPTHQDYARFDEIVNNLTKEQ